MPVFSAAVEIYVRGSELAQSDRRPNVGAEGR